MKISRFAFKRKKRYVAAKPVKTTGRARSFRLNKIKHEKVPRRWKSFYFWMPFYLVFLLVLLSVGLGWVLHREAVSKQNPTAKVSENIKGRSGGNPFLGAGESLSLRMRKAPLASDGSFLTAWGDKSVPPEYIESVIKPQKEIQTWERYAVDCDVEDDVPVIAIVIDDLGLNRKMTKEIISLPAPLTVSFMSYADDLDRQTLEAKNKGHELLLHTPMEPFNNDPGPGALFADMDDKEIQDRLNVMFDSFSGYVGINNHMGSRFTSDRRAMDVVMAEVKKRGLLFLDSLTARRSTGKSVADAHKVPYAVRNVFLDNARKTSKVTEQLHLLEKVAERNGTAVGIGHPHKVTAEALKTWIPEAQKRGFAIVPVSTVVRRLMQNKKDKEAFEALNHPEEE